MRTEPMGLLALSIFLLTSTIFNPFAYAADERQVLSRNYVGLGVEVHAAYQIYPGEIITVKVKIEALENVKNASVTLFLWSSQSEGQNPWSTSFAVLDITDFPTGAIEEEAYNITIPSDIDPGLIYGILFLDWSIYRSLSWKDQWDKASFRATYVKDRDFEDLQKAHQSARNDLQNTRILTVIFFATTIISVALIVRSARKRDE